MSLTAEQKEEMKDLFLKFSEKHDIRLSVTHALALEVVGDRVISMGNTIVRMNREAHGQ